MPHVKPSSPGGRVVKKTLADGTIKVYRYSAYAPKPAAAGARTLGKLIADWQLSPEWRKLAPRSQETYGRNIQPLLHPDYAHQDASAITRHSLIELRNTIVNVRWRGGGFPRGRWRTLELWPRQQLERYARHHRAAAEAAVPR